MSCNKHITSRTWPSTGQRRGPAGASAASLLVNNKRISGLNRGGWRRHGDPPAWLDPNLPLEQRRQLLDEAIRAVGRFPQQTATVAPEEPDARTDPAQQQAPKQLR